MIIGAGGHGRVIADMAASTSQYEQIQFVDQDQSLTKVMNYSVIHSIEEEDILKADWIVAIGNNRIRQQQMNQLKDKKASIATLIHPSAILGSNVTVGAGTVVMAGVVIQCGSQIGEGCIINTSVSVDHDNIIGDYVHISPGSHLAGTVTVGSNTWLGIGTIVKNNLTIGSDCQTGAGAVVVSNLTETGCYIGIPARLRKEEQ